MSDANEIVRQRQSAIRRELDRRGIALKAVSFDAGLPYPTLLTYFPQEGGRDPVMMPMGAVYACAESKAIPDDLLSLLLPAGCVLVRLPENVDHDEACKAMGEYMREKHASHAANSPAGTAIAPCEDGRLRAKLAVVGSMAA